MPGHIVATARTPWARRHGPLAATHPEQLLAGAIQAAVERAGLGLDEVRMVVAACDNQVGAQAANIARRVMLALGAPTVPAYTIDGQQSAGLALLGLVRELPGPVIIAAVESTSLVAPGAALVRDYGRPRSLGLPEVDVLEAVASRHGLTRELLDDEAERLRRPVSTSPVVTAITTSSRSQLAHDIGAEAVDLRSLPGLVTDDGLLSAGHQAALADGAVALVLGGEGLHRIDRVAVAAHAPADTPDAAAAMIGRDGATALVDAWAVTSSIARAQGRHPLGADDGVASVLALGSAPSADGLRVLVDACAAITRRLRIVRRGRGGQVVTVDVAADPP